MVPEKKPILEDQVDRLTVKVFEDEGAMGVAAGSEIASKIKELSAQKASPVRMVFAAAPSQTRMLETLANDGEIDWSRVVAYHMDEYVGLSDEAPQNFGRFLRDALFDVVNPGEVHLIKGTEVSIEEECKRYATLLQAAPIDIVCLGIGENAHIAFNEPSTADFDEEQWVKPVQLDDASRQQQVNDGLFSILDAVPTQALTLTIPALMSGTHLFCTVPGENKRTALESTLRGAVSTDCPASVLRRHTDCVLYADVDAYGN